MLSLSSDATTFSSVAQKGVLFSFSVLVEVTRFCAMSIRTLWTAQTDPSSTYSMDVSVNWALSYWSIDSNAVRTVAVESWADASIQLPVARLH